ncbi:AI-2E family transporter [Corynebacterium lizhenjunii]
MSSDQPSQAPNVRLSAKLDGSVDPELLASISPHPPGDQVDRSVVVADMVKAASLWALRLFIIGAFLYALSQMLGSFWRGILPVLLALIVCTVLAPLASKLRRAGLPSAVAAILCILLFFGIFGGLFAFIAPDFVRQSHTLYLQTVEGIQRLQLWVQGPPLNIDSEDLGNYVDEAARWIQNQAGAIAGGVFSGIGLATSVLVTLFIVLVLTFFFLKDGHKFLGWLRGTTGRLAGWHLTEVLTRSWNTLGGFVRAQAMVSAIDAVFIGAGLVILQVPMALALAIITFIAGFIPFVGAIVAGALSVIITLISLGFTKAIIVLILVLVVQQLEGNVLSPWLQSKAMDLHPVVVLISVTIGSALFNLIGSFLAVPVVATLAVMWRYLQDILQLQSGEKKAEDLEFATVAGYLIGTYTEEEGRVQRAARAQSADSPSTPPATAPLGSLEDVVDMDASLQPSRVRSHSRTKDVFDRISTKVFDTLRK